MYLHFLGVVFTLLGLGVFGISPATAALFSVIHKWFEEYFDIQIFKNLFSVYKIHFFETNSLGIILISIGMFLYVDMNISQKYIEFFMFISFY